MLQSKAEELETNFGKSWFRKQPQLDREVKKKHDIQNAKVTGEATAAVDMDEVKEWLENRWTNIRQGFAHCDIFNADETGLFFNLVQSRTLKFKSETYASGKFQNMALSFGR